MSREVRLERMHPREVSEAMQAAPIAWVPLGAVEFHAEHLPFGTDGFSAQQIVERAARQAGGVVLPWSYVTLGTLALPWTFRYDATLVEGVLRQTIEQLIAHGARVVIVHTGHGPLDLNHLIKRVCAEVEAAHGDRERGPRLRPLLPRAQRGARRRARHRLAGRGRPRLDHRDVLGHGDGARPGRARPAP